MRVSQIFKIIIFFSFIKVLWADPFTANNISSTQNAASFLSVSNYNNTTDIWVKTWQGKEILIWKHSPALASNEYLLSFNADRQGDYLSLSITRIHTPPPFTTLTIIINLKNGIITPPSSDLYTYTSDGIGLYSDDENPNILLLRPIFGTCIKPTIIYLNKSYLKPGFSIDPIFNDNMHLAINYIAVGGAGGVLEAPGIVSIDPAKIFAQCGQKMN